MSTITDTPPALTWRQMMPVYAILGLAILSMMNRTALPTTVLPEYWGSASRAEAQQHATELQLAAASVGGTFRAHFDKIVLEGHDTLFVGDSITRNTPDQVADVISLHGADATELRQRFPEIIGARQYHAIVLWPGSAHLRLQGDKESYVAGVMDMIHVARAHSKHVYVVTPMPGSRVPDFAWLEYVNMVTPSRMMLATREMKRRVADAHYPDVHVYDGGSFRSRSILNGEFASVFEDRVHPNARGMQIILSEIDALFGFELSQPWQFADASRKALRGDHS